MPSNARRKAYNERAADGRIEPHAHYYGGQAAGSYFFAVPTNCSALMSTRMTRLTRLTTTDDLLVCRPSPWDTWERYHCPVVSLHA